MSRAKALMVRGDFKKGETGGLSGLAKKSGSNLRSSSALRQSAYGTPQNKSSMSPNPMSPNQGSEDFENSVADGVLQVKKRSGQHKSFNFANRESKADEDGGV